MSEASHDWYLSLTLKIGDKSSPPEEVSTSRGFEFFDVDEQLGCAISRVISAMNCLYPDILTIPNWIAIETAIAIVDDGISDESTTGFSDLSASKTEEEKLELKFFNVVKEIIAYRKKKNGKEGE
jgi:hypothetical protein